MQTWILKCKKSISYTPEQSISQMTIDI